MQSEYAQTRSATEKAIKVAKNSPQGVLLIQISKKNSKKIIKVAKSVFNNRFFYDIINIDINMCKEFYTQEKGYGTENISKWLKTINNSKR